MQYHSIVYISEATAYLSDEALLALLEQARDGHLRGAVTGLLLYSEGQFMQVLEGPPEQLREYFARIAADPRHGKLQVLANGPQPRRDFGGWYMGFAAAAPEICRHPNYLAPPQLLATAASTPVHPLLYEFLQQARLR